MDTPCIMHARMTRILSSLVFAGGLMACNASLGNSVDESLIDDPNLEDPIVDDDPPVVVPFQPSNIGAELIGTGQAPLVLDDPGDIIEIDTTNNVILVDGNPLDLTGIEITVVSQGDPALPELTVFSATDLVVTPNTIVAAFGDRALVFALSGSATIEGFVALTGGLRSFSDHGAGGFLGGNDDNIDGSGPGGGKNGGVADTGGGGAGHVALGGIGGARANTPGGDGGIVHGEETLVPLVGGSGGGRGGDLGGPGGGGGGAIQISAVDSITISGATGGINAGGGGGRSSGDDDGGGGAGAGGAILLEAPTVTIDTGFVTANGGGGGSGGNDLTRGNNGQTGRTDGIVAAGGLRAGEGAAGGDGGLGNNPLGLPGQDSSDQENIDENAGGGGGASGRIAVRANSLQTTNAVISPTATNFGLVSN